MPSIPVGRPRRTRPRSAIAAALRRRRTRKGYGFRNPESLGQLSSPHTTCPTCLNTFIGDYFGNTSAGGKGYTTSVTTYNDGTNRAHYQQQLIAILAIP
jgi:hypothetical protein